MAFLAAGDAPVFIGFGSMPVPNPQRTTELILDALGQSGQRGILLAGWAKLGTAHLPDTVFPLEYAPYGWLFPRMAAVIHHGGSGTTGLALRSGVPSMVVPFTADQPFWGGRTYDLGVGPAPIPFSKLTARTLAGTISILTQDEIMYRQATQLRDVIAGEDGVQRAVENYLRLSCGLNCDSRPCFFALELFSIVLSFDPLCLEMKNILTLYGSNLFEHTSFRC